MRTQCPSCSSTYTVRAHHLKEAMGYVRCPNCKAVFNALSFLTDEGGGAPEIGIQLPFIHAGDRAVVDRSYLEQTGVFSSLEALRRREAERLQRASFDQTQVIRVGQISKVALPDSKVKLRVKETVRERDLEAESRLAEATRPSFFLTHFSDWALALRNILRHKKRTAVGLSAVGFGVLALLLASGFIEWIYNDMRETTIRSQLGHIQVAKAGYFSDGRADPAAYVLPADAPPLQTIAAMPHVETIAQRLSFTGLASVGETTISFLGEGVEPSKEAKVSGSLNLVAGEGLSDDDPTGIIVGAGLAQNLGVEPGDTLVLLGTSAGGGVNAVEARVRGLFRTMTKAFDDTVLRVPISMARELTRYEGAHLWVVLLDETRHTDLLRERISQELAGAEFPYEVKPWGDLAEFYNKTKVLFSKQVNTVRAIIALIILVSISNTLVMSVMERTGEIGTLMAVGLKRWTILKIFLQEGFLLGLFGGALGLVAGVAAAYGITQIGIPMPPPPGSASGYIGGIKVTWQLAVITGVLAIVSATLASIYPAWKASRMVIVDALRKAR